MAKQKFLKELGLLCDKHGINAFLMCVCMYNKKYGQNEHKVIESGEPDHVKEIARDFVEIINGTWSRKGTLSRKPSYIQ